MKNYSSFSADNCHSGVSVKMKNVKLAAQNKQIMRTVRIDAERPSACVEPVRAITLARRLRYFGIQDVEIDLSKIYVIYVNANMFLASALIRNLTDHISNPLSDLRPPVEVGNRGFSHQRYRTLDCGKKFGGLCKRQFQVDP